MTTGIELLDRIERVTRRYLRAKAQARIAEDNVALNITGAPSETGIRSGGGASRVELGAMLSADAQIKANELFEELKWLREELKPYARSMPEGPEKKAVRMYYLRGQGLGKIGLTLGKRNNSAWTPDAVIGALQRGVEWLRKNTDIE